MSKVGLVSVLRTDLLEVGAKIIDVAGLMVGEKIMVVKVLEDFRVAVVTVVTEVLK